MTQGLKTGVTLAGLLVVLLVGVWLGWSALTAPLPDRSEPAAEGPCEDVPVDKGTAVRPSMVTVSVFNAGNRSGLANKTVSQFEDKGFGPGETSNIEKGGGVIRAQVWTTTKRDPAAVLVHRYLGTQRSRLVVKPKDQLQGVGVMVVVGDQMDQLVNGPKKVTAQIGTTICTPVASSTDPLE